MCLTKSLKIWKSIGFPSGRSGADLNELMGGVQMGYNSLLCGIKNLNRTR